jgi:hypothetical protein
VTPLVVERPILNRSNGYAGRPDALVLLGAEQTPTLIDIKTGNAYESHALQLAAYGNAEVYLNAEGVERDWQPPERYAIVHVGSDSAELLPVDVDARTFRTFLYVREAWLWAQQARQAWKDGHPWPVGEPVRPTSETTAVSR